MESNNENNLLSCFSIIEDPRLDRKKRHKLLDILAIAICAVLCHAETWNEMQQFGESKKEWFQTFLDLPNGIPSHDTFRRVFILLDPEEFKTSFQMWVQTIAQKIDKEIISIDGKTSRRTRGAGKKALHMVSAFANENGLVLGQIKTDEKSNEITAIPKLLKKLEIAGCIVTIDAMGTQKTIAHEIINKNADYVLSLKGNHELFHQEVEEFFTDAFKRDFKDVEHSSYETVEKDHGRIETRRYWLTSDIEWFSEKLQWKDLKSIGAVRATREIGENISCETRYYITSLQGDVKEFARAVRGHWGIENSLHWVLDIAFREDDSRIRTGNAPENMAILRQLVLNLVKQGDSSKKIGIKSKRKKAGWDNDYLASLLKNF